MSEDQCIWPDRETTLTYRLTSPITRWVMSSACPACGGSIEAHGVVGHALPPAVRCSRCGVSYPYDGRVVDVEKEQAS